MTDTSRTPGIARLLHGLAEETLDLVKSELRLTRMEVRRAIEGIGLGTAFLAIGSVLGMLGTLSLLAGLVLLVGDQWLPQDRYWLAALIVLVVTAVAGLVIAKRGLALVAPPKVLPVETAKTLKEDTQWLKRQLTSSATSS